jgi:hypothetical protein
LWASGPAHAQSNPYTPAEVCNTSHGGGFSVIDQANLAASGASGIVYLMKNSVGWMCAVTIKTANVGNATPTSVRIQRHLGPLYTDSGPWNFYAGPVYTYARVAGVTWGGAVADNSGLGNHTDSYLSPCEHGSCTRGAVIANKAYYEYYTDSRNNEIPMGSNCNYYSGYFGLGGSCSESGFRSQEWCADFARYVWMTAGSGVKDTGDLTSWSLSFKAYGQAHGTWNTGFSGIAMGDVVVYDDHDGTGHVGIVVHANGSSSTIISGNYSNKISIHSVGDRSNYAGYTEPAY